MKDCTKDPNTCSHANPEPGNPECPECTLTHEECQEGLADSPGAIYVDFAPVDGCTNPDTYGCICVKCNKCGRFGK